LTRCSYAVATKKEIECYTYLLFYFIFLGKSFLEMIQLPNSLIASVVFFTLFFFSASGARATEKVKKTTEESEISVKEKNGEKIRRNGKKKGKKRKRKRRAAKNSRKKKIARRNKAKVSWTQPQRTLRIPLGFGPGWGTFSLTAFYIPIHRVPGTEIHDDPSYTVGVGIGNAKKWVAISLLAFIEDVEPKGETPAGSLGIQISRRLPLDFGFAIGAQNAVIWNDKFSFNRLYFGSLSKLFHFNKSGIWFREMTATIGVGTDRDDVNDVNFYWGIALRILPPISLIVNYRTDLSIGLSIAPFRNVALHINPSISNLTKDLPGLNEDIFSFSVRLCFQAFSFDAKSETISSCSL